MNLQLYSQRYQSHLAHASSLYSAGDYVQAGEKIWGALSALINIRFQKVVTRPEDKKRHFHILFFRQLAINPGLRQQMQQAGFKKDREVFDVIYGLHKFFYGGANYTSPQLMKKIPFLIQLISGL